MNLDDASKIAFVIFVVKEFYSFFRGDQKILTGKISDLSEKIHGLELKIYGLYSRLEVMEKLDSARK